MSLFDTIGAIIHLYYFNLTKELNGSISRNGNIPGENKKEIVLFYSTQLVLVIPTIKNKFYHFKVLVCAIILTFYLYQLLLEFQRRGKVSFIKMTVDIMSIFPFSLHMET